MILLQNCWHRYLPNPGVLVLAPKGNDVEVCGLVKRLFPVFCPNVKEFVLGVLKFIDLFPNNPGVWKIKLILFYFIFFECGKELHNKIKGF